MSFDKSEADQGDISIVKKEWHPRSADRLCARLEGDALLKEALEDLLARYESKAFGGLLATQPSPDGDRPLVHARLLSDSVAKSLCGADDRPWSARGFDFPADLPRLPIPRAQSRRPSGLILRSQV